MKSESVLKMLKIAFRGLGREAVNNLVKEFNNPNFPTCVYLDETAQDALHAGKRYFVNISKKTLDKEIAILNNINGNGIEILNGNMGVVETLNANTSSIGKLIDKIKTINATQTVEEILSRKEILDTLKHNDTESILSFGAGVGVGRLIPGKIICYQVNYPSFKIENKEAAINFLKQLRDCKTVVNSMFCFAGSARIYDKAIKKLEKEEK